MYEEQQYLPDKNVITITQQCGCDGGALAAQLAYELGWTLADQDEIAAIVADKLGLTTEQAQIHNERAFTLPERLLLSMRYITAEGMENWSNQSAVTLFPEIQEHLYHEILQDIIGARARQGNQVIVGHGAQVLLTNWPNVLHVRIVAPMEQRIRSAMQHDCLANEARTHVSLLRKDQRLAHYIRSRHHRDINDPLLYDLILNSSWLDRDDQIAQISQALRRSSKQEILMR